MQKDYYEYNIDLSINLTDKNIRNSFFKTIEKVKEKYDHDGYYNALFNNDPFAIAIDEIVNFDFDKIKFKKIKKNIEIQLSLF